MKEKLIGIFICMLLITTVLSVSGTEFIEKISGTYLIEGNTLYVGGDGPGNYTTIQEAVDDAVDGDTVFVYDDSSPYYENLVINTSIDLVGENKDSTIIDGSNAEPIAYIIKDNVTISGFTIQNCIYDGILISQEEHPPWTNDIYNVNVFNNNIKNVSRGIFGITLINSNIYNNIIEDIDTGIVLGFSSYNNISGNFITHADYRGIEIHSFWHIHKILDRIFNNIHPPAKNNIVYRNTVENNRWGIDIGSACIGTKVIENNIINNHETGLEIYTSTKTEIKRNNFIQTENYNGYEHAYFSAVNRFSQYISNSWDENYWGEPKEAPVSINGKFHLVILIPIGINGGLEIDILEFPLVKYDKNPAQEPYVI